MLFRETAIRGAYIIEPERHVDHRGFFARVWCKDEFERMGLNSNLRQSNIGFSTRKGTVRGLHLQTGPYAEAKIVRCTRGAIFDVIVDLRRDSTTFKRWFGVELTAENGKLLYVPEGFAQGYMTLEDYTEMNYHTSQYFNSPSASGVRFDDPAFGINWPLPAAVISEQDRNWPLMKSSEDKEK